MQFATVSRGRQTTGGTTAAATSRIDRLAGSNRTLWTTQAIVGAIFLFAGVSKLLMPLDTLSEGSPFPGEFLKFIGLAETLGGIGVVLPGLLRIRTSLVPLAAAGLVVIMVGAVVSSLATGAGVFSLIPFVVGLGAAFIAYGRSVIAPHSGRQQFSELQTAQ